MNLWIVQCAIKAVTIAEALSKKKITRLIFVGIGGVKFPIWGLTKTNAILTANIHDENGNLLAYCDMSIVISSHVSV